MNLFQQVSFEEFIKEYKDNLNTSLPIHPSAAIMFMGRSMSAFDHMMKELTKHGTVPLQIGFDAKCLALVSKNTEATGSLLRFWDTTNLGKLNSYELLSASLLFLDGKFDKFWDHLIVNFGLDENDKMSKDEFFYLIDTMFRGFGKLLIKASDDPLKYLPRNYRLHHTDIKELVSVVFGEQEFLEKGKSKACVERVPKLYEFLEYIHRVAKDWTKMSNKPKVEALIQAAKLEAQNAPKKE
jgi:hypothetical protein